MLIKTTHWSKQQATYFCAWAKNYKTVCKIAAWTDTRGKACTTQTIYGMPSSV